MAKGMRSKSARKNRAALRLTLTQPALVKRQLAISVSLQASLQNKNSSLEKLRKLFPISDESTKMIEDTEEQEEEVEEDEKKDKIKSKVHQRKNKVVKSAPKPKFKSQKEMVWFK
jgi:hypothetical protein